MRARWNLWLQTPLRKLGIAGAVGALLIAGGPALAGAATAEAAQSARPGCDAATLQSVVGSGTTVVSARPLTTPNTGTAYCRVDGTIATSGPGGGNTVNFQVSLPDAFAGRYLFLGIGGAAGSVTDPEEARLRDGWAQASTDARGPGTILDYTFAVDRTAALDWSSRGVYLSTVETQRITRAYYGLGTSPGSLYRYISGCSGGGRMGLVEAGLHPSDYDGVMAGAPGTNNLNILKFGQVVDYVLHHPASWVSPEQLTRLEDAVISTYDARDGAVDGLVRDPKVIDTSRFGSWGIFTPEQLGLINLITSDLKVGNRVYRGYPASNPKGWAEFLTGLVPPSQWSTQPPPSFLLFDTNTRAMFGLDFDFRTDFDFSDPADLNRWVTTFEQVFPGQNPSPSSFDTFTATGGKVLIWQGASDNGISEADTVDLYQRIAEHDHGYPATQRSIRLFTAPGVYHCYGGPGPQDTPDQALDALAHWVEKGRAPQSLLVHSGAGQPKGSFLLCPYPQRPTFVGGVDNPRKLDVRDAANWLCRS